jgi:AcrR family transcriptional regulator
MGTLARPHSDRGLPRGRGSLPPSVVAYEQRDRMMRGMTSAAADLGYANVRITDVVELARVSRQSFYAQFADKEECFLAAHARGVEVILQQLAQYAAPGAGDPRAQLTNAITAYLDLAAHEVEFARCMLIELPAIGPAGLFARIRAHRQIAGVMQKWHRQACRSEGWPAVPRSRYAAAVGAVEDLLFDAIADRPLADHAALRRGAVDAVMTLLEIPATD